MKEFIKLLEYNPYFKFFDDIASLWFDFYFDMFLKLYYFPYFLATQEPILCPTSPQKRG